MPACVAEFLHGAVRSRVSTVISGGTGSGKTTLLNALSAAISTKERVITIEDAAELQMQQPHVVRMETRPPNIEGKGEIRQRELVKNALRMRPVQVMRLSDGKRRLTSVSEITGMEGNVVQMQEIFAFHRTHTDADGTVHGEFRASGLRPKCHDEMIRRGIRYDTSNYDPTHPLT
jgi:Flp pilus assembly CpaF family ATPase